MNRYQKTKLPCRLGTTQTWPVMAALLLALLVGHPASADESTFTNNVSWTGDDDDAVLNLLGNDFDTDAVETNSTDVDSVTDRAPEFPITDQLDGEGDDQPPIQDECPPEILSSEKEVIVQCNMKGLPDYEYSSDAYRCGRLDGGIVCEGSVDEYQPLPACSILEISSCDRKDLYENIESEDGVAASGPCLWVEMSSDEEQSAECYPNLGLFQCYDTVLGEWCEGTTPQTASSPTAAQPRGTTPPDLDYTCPPDVVYSRSEAEYFCYARYELNVLSTDAGRYRCDYMFSVLGVCEGTIDSTMSNTPECSATVSSCKTDDMNVVCDDLSTTFLQKTCDKWTKTFECFDKTLDQYCHGQVVADVSEKPKESTPPEVQDEEFSGFPGEHQSIDFDDDSPGESEELGGKSASSTALDWNDEKGGESSTGGGGGWSTNSMVFFVLASIVIAMVVGRSMRSKRRHQGYRLASETHDRRRFDLELTAY